MSIDALNDKIAKQQERLNQLKAQKQALEAKQRKKQSTQQRKDEDRKKILLGAYLLKKMSEDENIHRRIMGQLDQYLSQNRDRKIWGLPDIIVEVKPNPNPEPELEQSKLDL